VTINLVAQGRNIHVILMEFPGAAGVGRSICYRFKYFNIFSIHLNFKLKAPLVVSSSQMGSIN